MNRTQIDRWFALNDRVDQLLSRKKITPADASNLLTPIRRIEDLTAGRELDVAEREIARVEKTGVLLGSAESLSASQAQERCDAFFASRQNR